MYYYLIAIIGQNSPPFSYASHEELQEGECVCVSVKTRTCKGVVIKQHAKPSFECKIIKERLYTCYTSLQIKMAHFIASYYLCTLGESFQLFVPTNAYPLPQEAPQATLNKLSDAQQEVFEGILQKKHALLFGDTGSGKTEVYFHLIQHALQKNTQVLFLMPEISLTPQIQKRLQQAFGDHFGIWHSRIGPKKRQEILQGIQNGKIRIIAGARSALFLPLHNLSLIIVDEEHDDAYKSQQGTPLYNAKDIALWLSRQPNIQTLLGSATPTVALYHKLQEHRFRLQGGYFQDSMQEIEFVQGCDEPTAQSLTQIAHTLQAGQQVIIFLPTRANYKYIICPSCAKSLECQECAITLSYHEKEQKISCHHCNYTKPIPKECPYCQGELIFKRIGTMELAKRLEQIFPHANIQRLDKDSTSTLNKLNKILKDFSDNKIQILIGTQMISKGHDYPNVDLVVVLGIDYLLKQADYRSSERVMALLRQLCGRSGRKNKGKVVIQTGQTSFFATHLRHYEKFLQNEVLLRGQDYPPSSKLAMLHLSDKNLEKLQRHYQLVHDFFIHHYPCDSGIKILAGGVCDIEKLASKWRYYLLISSHSPKILHHALMHLLQHTHDNPYLHRILYIDIDPVSFM